MKIIVIGNGPAPSLKLLQDELASKPIIICADGGANSLYEHQIIPHYIIGDFDSILPEALQFFIGKKVTIERHPSAKDLTDSHLALLKALELAPKITKVVFLGFLGGLRVDHMLANLSLLDECLSLKIPAYFKDDFSEAYLLNQSTKIYGKEGQIFSALAYTDEVKNLSIIGGKYQLQNFDLKRGNPLTISNEFLADEVSITFDKGKLLVVQLN